MMLFQGLKLVKFTMKKEAWKVVEKREERVGVRPQAISDVGKSLGVRKGAQKMLKILNFENF